MKDKSKNISQEDTKSPKQNKLLKRLERIEKKLDLFKVLDKSVPAMFVTTLALVSFIIYAKVTVIPTESELPQTGETVTSRLKIISPENNAIVSSSFEIIAVAVDGYYEDGTSIIFYVSDINGDTIRIGEAEKGSAAGEYRVSSSGLISGSYSIYAVVKNPDGTSILRTEEISVDIEADYE